MRSTLLTVPLVGGKTVSRVEISLSRSSSAISGRTMNINSYVRFIYFSPNPLVRLRIVVLLAVEAVHGRCRTFRQNHVSRFASQVEDFVDDLQLPLGERPQNSFLGSDPEADAQELLHVQRPDDRLHPVVSRRTAPLPDANRAQRQVQFVVNHDQVRLRTQLILVQEFLY